MTQPCNSAILRPPVTTYTLEHIKALRLATFPHEPMLVDPIFATDTLTLLYGPQGSGKTQLALTLAKAVSTGTPFLDLYPCQQGTVVYVMIDMTRQETQSRLRFSDQPEFDECPIYLVHADTFAVDLTRPQAGELAAYAAFAPVRALNPVLTIFDSLAKVHMRPENEADTSKAVYTALRTLVPMGGLLGLHHPRKSPQEGFQGARQQFEGARGTSGWVDDAAQAWKFERDFKKRLAGEYASTLTFPKVRASEQEPLTLRFREGSLLIESVEQTPLQVAQGLVAQTPSLSEGALVKLLQGLSKCSRATAYRAAKQALLGA